MLTRFNAKIGSSVLIGLSLVYMTVALIKDHSAHADPPVELKAQDAGLDVWHALTLLLDHPGELALLDVRSDVFYGYYKLPHFKHLAGASANTIRQEALGKSHVLLIMEKDDEAAKLVGTLHKDSPGVGYHFLLGGAASWYLNLELPAPLFSATPPPFGYSEAMAALRHWLAHPNEVPLPKVREAITKLVTLGFTPDQLAGKKKAPGGAPRKKISGGCG